MQSVSLIDQLKDSGHRITKTRKEITDIFTNSDSPITANDILQILDHSVNKTTVYRELDFLEKKGIITSLPLSLEEQYYELDHDHHHHLICEKCRTIQRYDNCLLEKLEEDIKQSEEFLVNKHAMEFYGICRDCQ